MNEPIEVQRYITEVMNDIHAPASERQRIETDLHAHVQEALTHGETVPELLGRMGTPGEVAAEFMSQVALPYASFWLRLAAFVIDWVLILAVSVLLIAFIIVCSTGIPRNPVGLDWAIGALLIALSVSAVLVVIGVQLLYFPVLEGRFGQTLGKRMLGLWVLKENGLPIGYKEAFLRRLSFYFRFIPIDALFIPFTDKHQRAFDIVARTIVVRAAS